MRKRGLDADVYAFMNINFVSSSSYIGKEKSGGAFKLKSHCVPTLAVPSIVDLLGTGPP